MSTHEAKQDLVEFKPSRLPYDPRIEKQFDVSRSQWKALVEAVFPLAKTVDSVALALSYCKARKLDVFKRPVHIVPMWDSSKNGYVETIWTGIAELRTTAHRTGEYAGCDDVEFGPLITKTFKGKVKGKDGYADEERTVTFPEWARLTVYRIRKGATAKFTGPRVYWLEAYASIGKSELPNDMWFERPYGQIEKCAEAAAIRRAFPEETGGEQTAEEMAGRKLTLDARELQDQVTAAAQSPAKPRDLSEVAAATKARRAAEKQDESNIIDADSAPAAESGATSGPDDTAAELEHQIYQEAEARGYDDYSAGVHSLPKEWKGQAARVKGWNAGQRRGQEERGA